MVDQAYDFIYKLNVKCILSFWEPMDVIPKHIVKNTPGFIAMDVKQFYPFVIPPSTQEDDFLLFSQTIGAHIHPMFEKLKNLYGSVPMYNIVQNLMNSLLSINSMEILMSHNQPYYRLAVCSVYACYALAILCHKSKIVQSMIHQQKASEVVKKRESSTVGPSIFPSQEVQMNSLRDSMVSWVENQSIDIELKKVLETLTKKSGGHYQNKEKVQTAPQDLSKKSRPNKLSSAEKILAEVRARQARRAELRRSNAEKKELEKELETWDFNTLNFLPMSVFPNRSE